MADDKKTSEKASADPVEPKAWKGSLSASEPVVAPDGHVNLSEEDIKERDANS